VEQKSISRRRFIEGASVAGTGGLLLGGAAGLLFGGGDEQVSAVKGASTAPINVGTPLPLTGPLAGDGEEGRRGSILAVEEINAAGGIYGRPIKQHIVDMGDTSPDKVRTAYSLLVERNQVEAIVMSYLFASGPDFDIVRRAGIPYIHHNALSDSVDLVAREFDKYWMVFQDDPTEKPHGVGLFGVLAQLQTAGTWKPRDRSVFIVTSDSAYSTKIAARMNEESARRKWTVAGFEKVVSPFTQWGPILQKIRDTNPDVIFNAGLNVGDIAAFQNQFMASPTKSLMYQQYVPSIPEYLELTGRKSEGVIWATVQGLLDDNPVGNGADGFEAPGAAFTRRFTKRWGESPGGSTAPAIYDSFHIYANAVREAGGPEDRRRVADRIRSTVYRGATGAHSFDPANNCARSYPTEVSDPSLGMPHVYYQVRDGAHIAISPEPYVTGEFRPPPWL
jgi:branched-chain amino acid transport system substrate-binding protein